MEGHEESSYHHEEEAERGISTFDVILFIVALKEEILSISAVNMEVCIVIDLEPFFSIKAALLCSTLSTYCLRIDFVSVIYKLMWG